jgi:hypothetical protein
MASKSFTTTDLVAPGQVLLEELIELLHQIQLLDLQ